MIEQVLQEQLQEYLLQEQVIHLLEDVVMYLDRFWFALEYAYLLFKVGLALLGIYWLYRVFKYLVGFNRVN